MIDRTRLRLLAFLSCISLLVSNGLAKAESCYPTFDLPASGQIQAVAAQCKAVQIAEPSNCQRIVGERCQQSYDEMKGIRDRICKGFASESSYINSRQHSEGVASQKAAQDANYALNLDNKTISQGLASALDSESARISVLLNANQAAAQNPACAQSVLLNTYGGLIKNINASLSSMRDLLKSLGNKKKADAVRASSVSQTSAKRSGEMKSLLLEDLPGQEPSGNSDLKTAAIAAGAGGLGLLVVSHMGDGGSSPPAPDLGPPLIVGGKPQEAYNGNSTQLFDEGGLQVEASFTDRHKAQIAQALYYVPKCQRIFLKGVRIRNNPGLVWRSGPTAGSCLPGKNVSMNPPTIELNPTCYSGQGIHTALVLHELMHVLAQRRGLYHQYHTIFSRFPGCAVSPYSASYGGKNLNEDFAEAGRIALYPSSGQKTPGQCVDTKIGVARNILNFCGTP